MSDRSKSGNMYRLSGIGRQGGRRAGSGVVEDDYSEESGNCWRGHSYGWPRFPNDDVDPEELNGPCIVVKEGNIKEENK